MADKDTAELTEIEADFIGAEGGYTPSPTYKKSELEEKTIAELAVLAAQYVELTETTLKKNFKKAEIINIILNNGLDKKRKSGSGRKADGDNANSIIDMLLEILDNVKTDRDKKPLNKYAKKLFRTNAINIIDSKLENAEQSAHTASYVILMGAGALLVIEALIGFKNIPTLLKRWKDKKNANKTAKTE
jgi:hypothetical protein